MNFSEFLEVDPLISILVNLTEIHVPNLFSSQNSIFV